MENHFVDVEFKSLKKAFKFIDDNEFVFDLMDAPFNYEFLVVVNKKHAFVVRCWVNSAGDLKHIIVNK